MKKRVFVGIGISTEIQQLILEWKKTITPLPVRWLESKDLHVTLIAPWFTNFASDTIDQLKTAKFHTLPFTISFYRITFGPTNGKKLIWAEGNKPAEIISLKTKLEKLLKRSPEKRQFKTHLTLARFRKEDFSRFAIKKLDKSVLWTHKVNSFTLYESHLTSKGATYEALAEIPLK